MRMTCQRIGRPPISTSGLGIVRLGSWRPGAQEARPPAVLQEWLGYRARVLLEPRAAPPAEDHDGIDVAVRHRRAIMTVRRAPRSDPHGWPPPRPVLLHTVSVGLPPVGSATIDPGIFKAYDVRGTYPDQIDGDVAEQVGRGFVRVLA